MDSLWQDVRLALRASFAKPGFALVAIVILAIGIGANTAIYTLVDAVALRPLPVTRPSELYRLGDNNNCCVNTGLQRDFSLFSYPLYRHFREELPEFSGLVAFPAEKSPFSVRRGGSDSPAQPVIGQFVSANYFTTLGVPMAAGRGLVEDDDRPGAVQVMVLSYRAWRDQYGLDPAVVGGTFVVSAQPVTVVGITAQGFFGETLRANPPDLWMPMGIEPLVRGKSSLVGRPDQHWLYIVGRLRAGVSPAVVETKATTELRAWLGAHIDLSSAERAKLPEQRIVVSSAATGVSTWRARYADPLRILAVVSALVLLVACANLANLLLARTQPAQFALRSALGASRRRLVQQMLAGGVLLALAGGAAGVLVAYAGTRAIVAIAFRGATYVPVDTSPSAPVLAFATLVSILTGVVFTAIPAWIMSRTHPMEALRGSGRSASDRAALPRQGLVIVQVAVSLVLLVGAGLLTTSLNRLEHQEFGFETDGRLMVKVDPVVAGYAPEALPSLYDRLQDRLSRIAGVQTVSLSQYSPMEGFNWSGPISIEGRPYDPANRISSSWVRVGAHYFEAIGTKLVRGRGIDERDTAGAQHVAVVNETFVQRFFPDRDPIGRHVGLSEETGHALDYEIVGIVDDAKYLRADEAPFATFFIPLLQTVPYRVEGLVSMQTRSLYIRTIVLHVRDRRATLERDVRSVIAGIDPNLTVTGVMSFEEQLGRNFNQQRLVARLTALYGQLALLLAAVGLYGVTSHYVTRRTREIGIRMALGADRRRVLGMVLRRAMVQTAIGFAIGIPVALLAGRGLAGQLYGVSAHDSVVLASAVAILAVSAIVAALIPARRAATIDPVKALRGE